MSFWPNFCPAMNAQNLLLLSLLLLQFRFSSSTDTITINQTLQDGDILISKGRKFALGFFSPGKSKYRYVGIWYYRVPVLTVAWVANRDNPINGSSGVLSFNQLGDLILYSDRHQQFPVWSANISAQKIIDASTFTAKLLDSGNLVLVQDSAKRLVWQSFDFPTNTLLQGMKHGVNRTSGQEWYYTSWRSPDDPGTGNYSMKLVADGFPQYFLFNGEKRYCRRPWSFRKPTELYNFSFVHNQNESYFIYWLDDSDSFIVRIMLDDSGVMKRLTWREGEDNWKEYWSIPRDRCDYYGQCGVNSMCNPSLVNIFECDCLPGYEPKFQRDWNLRDGSGGCVRKRQESSTICGQGEGFVKVLSMKLPDTSAAAIVSMSMDRMGCERECLRDCSCTAYAIIETDGKGNISCLSWYGELMDAIVFNNEDSLAYDIYVRVDAIELAERARESSHFLEKKRMIAILVPCIASAWLVLVLVGCLCLKSRKRRTRRAGIEGSKRLLDPAVGSNFYRDDFVANDLKESWAPTDTTSFKLSTISAATNNFSADTLLGQGGFGSVYKGQLPGGNAIAVKRLTKDSGQGVREFTNEVMLTANLQHRNLVKLLGCCIDGDEHILIYEYLPNKSLDSFIFSETGRTLLDWKKRFDIIVGIARGILYLHHDSTLTIIHRDLKTSNILLDAEMHPKISDFGLARIYKGDQVQHKTKRVVGTYGYMSPECAIFGKFSVKSDVFSFGVMMLEIISGKKCNCFNQDDSFKNLIGHVWELWQEDKALQIMDSTLDESHVAHEVLRCIQIGLLCVQEDADDRPTMLAVVLMLNSEISFPNPKQPAYNFRKSPKNHDLRLNDGQCSVNDLTISDIETLER